jgi:hypothetical protein
LTTQPITPHIPTEDIANELKKHLMDVMTSYGISIVTALVTEMSPDARVRNSMNEVTLHIYVLIQVDVVKCGVWFLRLWLWFVVIFSNFQ